MILADAASDAAQNVATINAAWIALAGLLAGVVVTVLGGFIGAWLQNRREHQRWLREKRLDAYTRAMRLAYDQLSMQQESARVHERITEGRSTDADVESLKARIDAVRVGLNDMAAPLAILGPPSVERAVIAAGERTDDMDEFMPHYRTLVKEMRQALSIKR